MRQKEGTPTAPTTGWPGCGNGLSGAARPGITSPPQAAGKLFARARIAGLVDDGSFTEDGRYANALADGLPADGVITGTALVDGRPVALMANDSTVKAGSWGARTVEKIIRIIEKAYADGLPMIYLVNSAGARITDQVDMFPGRRGAGKIFHTQVRASGAIPQVCALFGPSAAGGAYIPAFCDFVAMVDGNASMYLGSPRMVEMVVREQTTLEEMGGARMHCTVSGCGHYLAPTEHDALGAVRRYLSYLPANWQQRPPIAAAGQPEPVDLAALIPASERQAFDMRRYIRGLVNEGSFFEIHALWARELTIGFARLAGQVTGVVANNPMFKGGVLFVDSADKATRFIQLCDAFNVPLLFLADVPGFMVGTSVEKAGHHPARREDDQRGGRGHRAEDLRGGAQGVRGRPVRDGRARVRAGRHACAAHREDRGDGGRRGRQRRVLQQAGRGGRPGGPGAGDAAAAGRVRGGYRRGQAGQRAGHRRHRVAGRAARRADPPVRVRCGQGPLILKATPWDHPSLTKSSRLGGESQVIAALIDVVLRRTIGIDAVASVHDLCSARRG